MLLAVATETDEDTCRTIERLAKDYRHPFLPHVTIRPRTLVSASVEQSAAILPPIALRLPGDARGGSKDAGARLDIELKSVLGEGGMGRVYQARQPSLGRDVAVKTLLNPGDPEHVCALISEGAITGALEHPNIPPIHQLGLAAEGPVLVMKRIAGVSWGDLLRDRRHPGWQRIQTRDQLAANIEVLMAVARALQFAHSRGIVHRDIKPDNVLIDEMGEVYLVDWGIATEISKGPAEGIIGTPGFLAPEMVMLDALSARTDVYLLGATLHYVLIGEYRNKGRDLIEMLMYARRPAPFVYPSTVPRELAELANSATAHDPAARPAGAGAFREALADYLAHRGSLALAALAQERLGELQRARASTDPVRAVQIAAEARFGFEVALKEWSANSLAEEGRQACFEVLAEIELERENLSSARAAIAELKTPRPDLLERARTLEHTLAERARSAERLKHLEHAADVGISRSARRLTALGLLVASATASAVLLSDGELRYRGLVWAGAIPFVMVLALGLALRKRLLANALGRKVFALLAGAGLLLFLHRLVSALGGTPIPSMLRDQLMLLSMAGLAGGLLGIRSWLGASGLTLLGAIVSSLLSDHSSEVFSVTVLVAGALIAIEPLPRPRVIERERAEPE